MKKYRNKKTGETIEAEQWFCVTYDDDATYHLGVEHFSTKEDSKCSFCDAFLKTHGYLRDVSSATISSATNLVCPGEYVVKDSHGDVYLFESAIFDGVFEEVVETTWCGIPFYLSKCGSFVWDTASKHDSDLSFFGPIKLHENDLYDAMKYSLEADDAITKPEPPLKIGDEIILKEFNKPVPKSRKLKVFYDGCHSLQIGADEIRSVGKHYYAYPHAVEIYVDGGIQITITGSREVTDKLRDELTGWQSNKSHSYDFYIAGCVLVVDSPGFSSFRLAD